MNRPDLCADGPVLFVGLMPPAPGGSSIVDRNLIACFDPKSVVIATAGNRQRSAIHHDPENRTHEIFRAVPVSRRLNHWLFRAQERRAARRISSLAKDIDARVIVGCHPLPQLIAAAAAGARDARIPWIAYLHDTLAESTEHLDEGEAYRELQKTVFTEASHLLVMSEGMSDLYRRRYDGLQTTALEHIYPLDVKRHTPMAAGQRKAFWAGNVYEINARAFARVSKASAQLGLRISMTSPKPLSVLQAMGIDTAGIDRVFYPDWTDYHRSLNDHELLILALDWPDESPMHHDELSTIFPTKTPEYLASGRPILVHCPENYFLARFFRQRGCGIVVSERSTDALVEAIEQARKGGPDISSIIQRAFSATDVFSPGRVANRFRKVVEAVAKVGWGQKVDVPSAASDS